MFVVSDYGTKFGGSNVSESFAYFFGATGGGLQLQSVQNSPWAYLSGRLSSYSTLSNLPKAAVNVYYNFLYGINTVLNRFSGNAFVSTAAVARWGKNHAAFPVQTSWRPFGGIVFNGATIIP